MNASEWKILEEVSQKLDPELRDKLARIIVKQDRLLWILRKFGYFACEVHENNETKRHLHVCKNGEFATVELTEGEFETIAEWLEENNGK